MSNLIRFEFYNNFDIWCDLYQENGGDPNYVINIMVYSNKNIFGIGYKYVDVKVNENICESGNGNEHIYGNIIGYGDGYAGIYGHGYGYINARYGYKYGYGSGNYYKNSNGSW